MDHFQKLTNEIRLRLFGTLLMCNIVTIGVGFVLDRVVHVPLAGTIAVLLVIGVSLALLLSGPLTIFVLKPLRFVWQAILHVSPGNSTQPAPDLTAIKQGKELVNALAMQVYQLASKENPEEEMNHRKAIIQSSNVVHHLPLPLFVFNKEQIVVNASEAGLKYCNLESSQLFGKALYESINMEFATPETLEKWIIDCQKNKVTDTAYWERVHVRQPNTDLRQCDIAAYYNRDNPSGTEFIVTMFDRTKQYSRDDDDISFIALAVHELRTPLTMLRGYIEVFEDELEGKLDEELNGYMHKMIVAAQQLAAFFNNILNVARIEQNQLTLNLSEGNWKDILTNACNDLNLKAQVHKNTITVTVADNLPVAAVDKLSIIEVINNLIDNAIKYSSEGDAILVDAHVRNDGLIETTFTDHGMGIPPNVVNNLFDKFYRNHRTAGKVGGTGLGLFLSKAIVNAHGGEIWVQSKEGQGSTFGFTLVPAAQLAAELKSGNNGIVRNAHGWIKNHSLSRR